MYRVLLLGFCLLALASGAPKDKHHHKDSLLRADDNEAVKFQSTAEFDQQWFQFQRSHEKKYEGEEEEEERKKIFSANLKEINEHNEKYDKGEETYTMGVNQFTDLTHVEFMDQISCLPSANLSQFLVNASKEPPAELFPGGPLADSVDWRSRGYVTRVKNQGRCGSCWSFAAVGALESQQYLKTGELTYLSEQQLVDCSVFNIGCQGGLPHFAFDYIRENGGIDREDAYQYEAEDGKCRYDSRLKGGHLDGWVLLPGDSEALLQRAIAYIGPVAIAIASSGFQHYRSGIFSCESRYLDHAVLAVGYGTLSPGRDYWIIKNSYGAAWGMDGYALLPRNQDNACGVGYYSTYPQIY